jgi:hypothetical protein
VATVTSRFNDSPCWKAMLKVKETYFTGRKVVLKMETLPGFGKTQSGASNLSVINFLFSLTYVRYKTVP